MMEEKDASGNLNIIPKVIDQTGKNPYSVLMVACIVVCLGFCFLYTKAVDRISEQKEQQHRDDLRKCEIRDSIDNSEKKQIQAEMNRLQLDIIKNRGYLDSIHK